MKYLIQIFRLSGDNVGSWHNTAWGNNDLEKTKTIAEDIIKNNKQNIVKVRVIEILMEIDNNVECSKIS